MIQLSEIFSININMELKTYCLILAGFGDT